MSGPKTCAVVPFRSLSDGKHRLGDVMNRAQRRDFMAAMLADTLAALSGCASIDELILLSDDPEAASLGRSLGAVCLAEAVGAAGLNSAVQMAATELSEQYQSLLVVHGDLPLLQKNDLERLLQSHKTLLNEHDEALSIVPDRHQAGSNCLLCTPMQRMRFYYGEGSLTKHLAFADRESIQSQLVQLDSASLDIDEPADLVELRTHSHLPSASNVAGFLNENDVSV